MAKIRKMLGDVNSAECKNMMALIETQSKITLASWAVNFAVENYLPIYTSLSGDESFCEITEACKKYIRGDIKLPEVKTYLKKANETAKNAENPAEQAAARALSVACAAVQTPTNSLGFLFYGCAAVAYSEKGTGETAETYAEISADHFIKAYASLKAVSVENEENPAKINWGC